MVIDNNNKDFVEVSMPSYIQSVIDDLDVKENETSDSPAAVDLFSIKPNNARLGGDEKDKVHTMVAKIFYLAKHARPGAIISIGRVPVFYKSSKQGLNANSSTQAEIIGISQILPQAVSNAEFIKEQMDRKVNINF